MTRLFTPFSTSPSMKIFRGYWRLDVRSITVSIIWWIWVSFCVVPLLLTFINAHCSTSLLYHMMMKTEAFTGVAVPWGHLPIQTWPSSVPGGQRGWHCLFSTLNIYMEKTSVNAKSNLGGEKTLQKRRAKAWFCHLPVPSLLHTVPHLMFRWTVRECWDLYKQPLFALGQAVRCHRSHTASKER